MSDRRRAHRDHWTFLRTVRPLRTRSWTFPNRLAKPERRRLVNLGRWPAPPRHWPTPPRHWPTRLRCMRRLRRSTSSPRASLSRSRPSWAPPSLTSRRSRISPSTAASAPSPPSTGPLAPCGGAAAPASPPSGAAAAAAAGRRRHTEGGGEAPAGEGRSRTSLRNGPGRLQERSRRMEGSRNGPRSKHHRQVLVELG